MDFFHGTGLASNELTGFRMESNQLLPKGKAKLIDNPGFIQRDGGSAALARFDLAKNSLKTT
jgi:hypothetical protein